jgi:hypothetical protein
MPTTIPSQQTTSWNDLEFQNQTISLSGVGAHHHQNGWPNDHYRRYFLGQERWCRNLYIGRPVWQSQLAVRSRTSPFGITYLSATDRHRWNIWGQIYGSNFLQRCRVWGSPCYVLDPSLTRWKANANTQAFATWNVHGTVESTFFVCRSSPQSTDRKCSPQYHVIRRDNLLLYTEPFQKNSLTLKSGIRSSNLTHTIMLTRMIIDGHPPFERIRGFPKWQQSRTSYYRSIYTGSGEVDLSDEDDDSIPLTSQTIQVVEGRHLLVGNPFHIKITAPVTVKRSKPTSLYIALLHRRPTPIALRVEFEFNGTSMSWILSEFRLESRRQTQVLR